MKNLKLYQFGLVLLAIIPNGQVTALGQIITDGSLGAQISLPGGNIQIPDSLGQQRGGNLFHSFQEFNIASGNSAIFTGPDSVQNIFSRVTGGNSSNINGTLGSDIEGANLFFLNPAGVMFGPDAQLDLSGNFGVTTADQFNFRDGVVFGSDITGDSSLSITTAPLSSFGFLGNLAGDIEINGSQWKLDEMSGSDTRLGPNVNLTLAGGDIVIKDGAQIESLATEVNLHAAQSPGTLDANNILNSDFQGYANISLQDGALINIVGDTMGRLNVVSEDLTLDNGSRMKIEPEFLVSNGGMNVIARGKLSLDQSSDLVIQYNSVFNFIGSGSDLSIDANEVEIMNGSRIINTTFGNARINSGNVILRSDKLSIIDQTEQQTGILSQSGGVGDAGDVYIFAKNIEIFGGLEGNTQLNTSSFWDGNAGDINLNFGDGVSLENARLYANSEDAYSQSKPGSIKLLTEIGDVKIKSTHFEVNSSSDSLSGEILINTGGGIKLDNSRLISDASSYARSGKIELNSKNTEIIGGSILRSKSITGAGDRINIYASDYIRILDNSTIEVSAGGIYEFVEDVDSGLRNGEIILDAIGDIYVENSRINNVTFNQSDSGNITIKSQGDFVVHSSTDEFITHISTENQNFQKLDFLTSDSGDINISAVNLNITGEGANPFSKISSSTNTQGKGGDVDVVVTGDILIDGANTAFGNVGIFSESVGYRDLVFSPSIMFVYVGGGDGGEVSIAGTNLKILNNGEVNTVGYSSGNAGNIIIDVDNNVIIDSSVVIGIKSDYSGVSPTAKSGDIQIFANNLNILNQAEIANVTSLQGQPGKIEIILTGGLFMDSVLNFETLAAINSSKSGVIQSGSDVPGSGDIFIKANDMELVHGAITTRSTPSSAGDINIILEEHMNLYNDSLVSISSGAGEGGKLIINTIGDLILENSSLNAAAGQNAGYAEINARMIILDNSTINANSTGNAASGQGFAGGTILLNGILIGPSNQLSATSQSGQSGTINVRNQFDGNAAIVQLNGQINEGGTILILDCERESEKLAAITLKQLSQTLNESKRELLSE